MYACMHACIYPSIYPIETTYKFALSQSVSPSRTSAPSQSQKHHSITERLLHAVCTHLHTYYCISLSFCSITEPDSITELCSITEPKASLYHKATTTHCMYIQHTALSFCSIREPEHRAKNSTLSQSDYYILYVHTYIHSTICPNHSALSQSLTPSRSFAPSQSQKHHSITERLCTYICMYIPTCTQLYVPIIT